MDDLTSALGNRRDLATSARRAACHMVKMRARHYARRPALLDALHPGLSVASPVTLVAIATYLVDRESRSPRRWFGFGGEVNLVNARAALLLGRARQRAERAEDLLQSISRGLAR